MSTNQDGLSRDIPDAIKRQVRQACGFGCVCCGASIIEYHHVDPPFSEAKAHDANGIVLLCPRCHAKAERHFLSEETIIQAMRNPVCRNTGYASEFLDVGEEHPKIVFAGVTFTRTLIPIVARGIPLFMIQKAEERGGHSGYRPILRTPSATLACRSSTTSGESPRPIGMWKLLVVA